MIATTLKNEFSLKMIVSTLKKLVVSPALLFPTVLGIPVHPIAPVYPSCPVQPRAAEQGGPPRVMSSLCWAGGKVMKSDSALKSEQINEIMSTLDKAVMNGARVPGSRTLRVPPPVAERETRGWRRWEGGSLQLLPVLLGWVMGPSPGALR